MRDKVLSTRVAVGDDAARIALREFFEAVLAVEGQGELERIYLAFYQQFHGGLPPIRDWSDSGPDGGLLAIPGEKVKSARNGK